MFQKRTNFPWECKKAFPMGARVARNNFFFFSCKGGSLWISISTDAMQLLIICYSIILYYSIPSKHKLLVRSPKRQTTAILGPLSLIRNLAYSFFWATTMQLHDESFRRVDQRKFRLGDVRDKWTSWCKGEPHID